MLDSKTLERLQTLAKDGKAFETLKSLFEEERQKAETFRIHLDLLESAIRNDYDSILIADLGLEQPGPKIVYVNDGFEKMTGFSRDEVIGETPRILQGPKTDRKVLDKLRQSLENGNSFFGQTVNYRKDGSEYINQWDIHPLINKNGEFTHWVSYQHDITERKRAEKKFVDSNVEPDAQYSESKSTFIDLGLDGTVIEANKAFREMLGYHKEEVLGSKLWDFEPANTTNSSRTIFAKNIIDNLKDKNNFQFVLRRKNGLPVEIEARLKALTVNGKKFIRAEIKNISLRKNVLKILQKRTDSFNKIFERKNDFNYGFALDSNNNPKILWISDGFSKVTGFSNDECTGLDGFSKFIHPEDLQLFNDHYKLIKSGKSSCAEFRIITKEGDTKKIMDYVKPDSGNDEYKGSVVEITGKSLKTV